jgi:hypothetical protein
MGVPLGSKCKISNVMPIMTSSRCNKDLEMNNIL